MSKSVETSTERIYSEELTRLVDEFRERITAGTRDPEHFMTMTEIEQLWSELRGNTSIIYSDMLQDILSAIDESELIRQKKTNIAAKE